MSTFSTVLEIILTNFLLEYGITNELATYMTFVLDPSVKDLVNYISGFSFNMTNEKRESNARYDQMILDMEKQLDSLLEENNIELLDLFRELAFK